MGRQGPLLPGPGTHVSDALFSPRPYRQIHDGRTVTVPPVGKSYSGPSWSKRQARNRKYLRSAGTRPYLRSRCCDRCQVPESPPGRCNEADYLRIYIRWWYPGRNLTRCRTCCRNTGTGQPDHVLRLQQHPAFYNRRRSNDWKCCYEIRGMGLESDQHQRKRCKWNT